MKLKLILTLSPCPFLAFAQKACKSAGILWAKTRQKLCCMLLLAPNTSQLSEAVISSEKSTGSFQMDKQTFNVAKLGNITSGTGLEVFQRLPSVMINAEGKILMCGNAEFLVTVNGNSPIKLPLIFSPNYQRTLSKISKSFLHPQQATIQKARQVLSTLLPNKT